MTRRISEVSAEAEAERTGQRSSQVRDDTAALNALVGDLKHALIRVVRTSTAEVNRRHDARYTISLACRLAVAGRGSISARIADISQHGAAVTGVVPLPAGTRGALEADRLGMALPFTVRSADHETMHLSFELDAAATDRFAKVVTDLARSRAA